jgi:hypothetical protein
MFWRGDAMSAPRDNDGRAYISCLNKLRDHPERYNALTKNCTTTLDGQLAADVDNPQPSSPKRLRTTAMNHRKAIPAKGTRFKASEIVFE